MQNIKDWKLLLKNTYRICTCDYIIRVSFIHTYNFKVVLRNDVYNYCHVLFLTLYETAKFKNSTWYMSTQKHAAIEFHFPSLRINSQQNCLDDSV